jgi:hypothetical protein
MGLGKCPFRGYNSGRFVRLVSLIDLYTGFLGGSMFESLSERIKEDEHKEINRTERIIRWVVIAVLSVVLFGGLYMAVRMLE